LPATSVPLSAPRFGLAWRVSQPRPDSTATVTPFADFTELLPFQAHGARHWGAPGPALHPHGLGQHPRQTPGTRRAPCGRPRRSSIARFGGGISACHITKNGMRGRPLRLDGPGLARSACAARLHTTWPRASPGATRSGVAQGPVPSRPVILDPCPLAPEGPGLWVMPGTWNRQTPQQLRRTNQLRMHPSGGQLAGTAGSTSPHSARIRLRLTGRR
jgi:hypothetical protein